jgi:protein TonB
MTAMTIVLGEHRAHAAARSADGPSAPVRVALASGVVAAHAALLLALMTLTPAPGARGPDPDAAMLVTAFLLPAAVTAPAPAPAAAPPPRPPTGAQTSARTPSDTPRRALAEDAPARPAPAAPAQPAAEPAPGLDVPVPATLDVAVTDRIAIGGDAAAATEPTPGSAPESSARPMHANLRAGPSAGGSAVVFAPQVVATASTGARRTPPDHEACGRAHHPAALRERGIEGLVRLRVLVGADGRAREVQLGASSGWRLFDEAALAQARGCRYRPAQEDGVAVDSWVEYPVRFALEATAMARPSP